MRTETKIGLLIGGVPLAISFVVWLWATAFGPYLSPHNKEAAGDWLIHLAAWVYGAGFTVLLLVLLPAILLGAASAIFGWGSTFLGLGLWLGRRRRD